LDVGDPTVALLTGPFQPLQRGLCIPHSRVNRRCAVGGNIPLLQEVTQFFQRSFGFSRPPGDCKGIGEAREVS
jgi:hypothetical protein